MNLAKVPANGQITVPLEIQQLLCLKSGDKILFFQKQDGEFFREELLEHLLSQDYNFHSQYSKLHCRQQKSKFHKNRGYENIWKKFVYPYYGKSDNNYFGSYTYYTAIFEIFQEHFSNF